jgi:hypothetical protein
MSWTLFKSNILRKTNIAFNNNNINDVAKIWANEYDACVKRGKDFINFESVQSGNKEIMETLFRVALLKGLTTPPGQDFSLVNEFGNGVRAYWAGAQMRPFPIPLIPAPGSIQNIAVNSNVVINTGTWPIYPPIRPARKQETMVDMFILAAIVHLFSIGGIIQTTSLYPSAPTPIPSPGVISWTGYLIPPAIPIPNINFPSEDGSEPPVIEQSDGSDGSSITSTNEATNQVDEQVDEQVDILDGVTTLDNVINTTLPTDVSDPIKSEEIIIDFKKQLEMGGTKCE